MRDVKYKSVFKEYKTGRLFISDDWGTIKGGFKSPPSISSGERIGDIQFTGLKDKNGKEIYEGDVIETSYGKVGTVVYYERSASFIVNDPSHFNEQLWHDAVNSEVIGNIYEQKELVK